MPSTPDRERKQQRLARVRADAGGAPLLLTSHEAVSWYLDGVRTHVSLAGPPVLAVRVDEAGDTLFVAANEADRLVAEDLLPADAARVVPVPWQTPPAEAAAAVGAATAESQVAAALRAARASLLPAERDRYRALGREVAQALTDVAAQLSPRHTERLAAAALAAGLVERGIDPLVVLVAGRARLPHRHPLPTGAALGDRAMLVVCGRRHGLIANATRWVGAAGADDERILAVEADFFAATRPGATLADAFAAGCAAYGAHGFGADEWQRHHQGGPTGYAGRDPRATAITTDEIVAHHAFAWNPSAPGAKVEDTVLVTAGGVEVLTADPRWPAVTHAGLRRPAPLPFP
ncbi:MULTISPECIES: M24 family metallopeptidase [unclassified Microbacterium]|uniref:M24 family metallopeptidase n=1 Tax=Microbacterium sp. zg-B96 TaxID=3049069 RepID=UPI0027D46058|nr:M24 family metallopeptidase [Microbacterium sp. zg.B96]